MDALGQLRVALQDDKINIIGLYGMGGVGKTTLVVEVGKQAQKMNLFDKVVVATVSQKPNFEAIQDQIAQYIGFDMKNERGRRSQQDLWLRLKKEQKILIILDDVWTEINLKENIGIPTGEDHKGCTILLTTRRQQVCTLMNCKKEVPLGCLNNNEAWKLFAEKSGLHDSSDDVVKNLANQFLKTCQGLPIAIVTLGTALKGKSREEWKVAYKRFKNRRLDEIEDLDVEKNAYVCFETSFNFLKDGTRKCFLLCSLFPEDDEIYVENLVRFAWGLELYGNNSGPFDDVRTEVLAAIKILKDSCLLLDCGERHVKMHDMVRDFALWITTSRKEMSFAIKSEVVETLRMDESFKDHKAIYLESKQTIEVREGLVFPNLEILSLGSSRAETSSEFFRGMEALKVFSSDCRSISLAAFQFQTNLRALLLFHCELSDISMLGKLKTLEILSLIDFYIIELPNEIGDLENLRVMELSSCRNLQGFLPGLLVRLSNLEELYLDGCESLKWARKNMSQEEEGYASISELNLLPKLVVLSLDINSEQIPDGFEFHKLLIRFDVCIGLERKVKYGRRDHETCPISKSLRMKKFVDACKQLLEGVESLRLENEVGHQNVIPSLEFCKGGFRELTFLHLKHCESMKCLVDASKQEEIAEEYPHYSSFKNLKEVHITNCKNLKYLFPMSVANGLGQLQKLEILQCHQLEEIIQIDGPRSIQQGYNFQSLKEVDIRNCNNLKYLFPMCVANSLGQLQKLKIWQCDELEEIIQVEGAAINTCLQNLREVEVANCNKLKSLFSLSQAHSKLENLTKLSIQNCLELEFIFPNSVPQGLPQLYDVLLNNLPRLKEMNGNEIVLTSPSIHNLVVSNCPQLTPLIISAKIQELSLLNMKTERKQIGNMAMVPELRRGGSSSSSSSSSRECLTTISNFEDYLFDSPNYNLSILKILHLSCLNELRVIWNGPIRVDNFRNLSELDLRNCKKLRYIFSPTMAQNLPQLSKLSIFDCAGLKEIIQKGQTSSQDHLQPLICFPNLTEIYILRCESLKCLFPITIAHGGLSKLNIIYLGNLSKLEQVFEGDEANVGTDEEKLIHLPQLKKILLVELPNLARLGPVGYHFVCPSLTDLTVQGCANITTSFSVDHSNKSVVAKTQASQSSFDNNIVEESATVQETTWPIGSDIHWWN